ncbi:MAG: stage V sporulation protein S [Candidatus Cloacimonetes bacterium]|nr:stage V sporulation protein S [Candidatus Cloacimonadota bacterium]
METLKVSSGTQSKAVAGAMAQIFEREDKVCIQAIGAGAVNQAVKAIAIARGFMAPKGIELFVQIAFVDLSIDSQERTGIKFVVLARTV